MVSQFQLIMRSGPTPGASFILEGDQLTVGRDATNEIVINDAEISRRHARLTFQGGKYVLEDLGSTNGTFVNGQRLAGPRVLKAGEVVQFGEQIMLVFEVTSMDAGATMVSPRASAAVPSVPRPPISVPPPPAVEYAGSIPASPAPVAAAPAKKMNLTPIIIGVVVFLILCCCISLFIWVDADPTGGRWCTFPFSIIAQILGSSCP